MKHNDYFEVSLFSSDELSSIFLVKMIKTVWPDCEYLFWAKGMSEEIDNIAKNGIQGLFFPGKEKTIGCIKIQRQQAVFIEWLAFDRILKVLSELWSKSVYEERLLLIIKNGNKELMIASLKEYISNNRSIDEFIAEHSKNVEAFIENMPDFFEEHSYTIHLKEQYMMGKQS